MDIGKILYVTRVLRFLPNSSVLNLLYERTLTSCFVKNLDSNTVCIQSKIQTNNTKIND